MNEPLKQENDRLRAYIAKLEAPGPAHDLIERLTKGNEALKAEVERMRPFVEGTG